MGAGRGGVRELGEGAVRVGGGGRGGGGGYREEEASAPLAVAVISGGLDSSVHGGGWVAGVRGVGEGGVWGGGLGGGTWGPRAVARGAARWVEGGAWRLQV